MLKRLVIPATDLQDPLDHEFPNNIKYLTVCYDLKNVIFHLSLTFTKKKGYSHAEATLKHNGALSYILTTSCTVTMLVRW